MTSPHCPARAAACNFFSACQGAKSFLLPLAKANTSRTRASNSPSSRVSKARESNFPSSRVSRARASNSPYFKGIQGQRIKLPSFKGIHGQSTKLPLLQGYPGHQTSLISRVSKGRGSNFPFSRVSKGNKVAPSLFSKVKGELLQCVLKIVPGEKEMQENPVFWCNLGTQSLSSNSWADAEGEARNLAHKIFIREAPSALWIQIPAVLH